MKPTRPYEVKLELYADDTYIKIIEDDVSLPTLSKLTTKIKDIGKLHEVYGTEGIVLCTPASAKEFVTEEDYQMITYTTIRDYTGQIRLVDKQDSMTSPISRLNIGDRIKVVGVETNSHYTETDEKSIRDITLTEYSSIQQRIDA
ncbi:MAG: hypothetical protein JO327_00445 [Nitrososphaeraceae archaeon]|nr:hypothetical protein [Nitrososphaeraceae archaeon]MBV9666576.1 hypothetical protein [Nitrososphaeraceae archaeon]